MNETRNEEIKMRKCKCEFWDRETKTRVKDVIGLFHHWGSNYEEFSSGPANYTVAIIELPGGRIIEAIPTDVQFME